MNLSDKSYPTELFISQNYKSTKKTEISNFLVPFSLKGNFQTIKQKKNLQFSHSLRHRVYTKL